MTSREMTTEERLGFDLVQSAHGISEYVLRANGLKVLLKEDRSKPVVTYLQVFKVGSRNERPADSLGRANLLKAMVGLEGTTGATHFLEHLMFKGTRDHDPANGTGVFETFSPLGNVLNATTSLDRTCYFECVSARHLEVCIEIEADRMRNLRFDPELVEAEREVVLEEMGERGREPDEIMMERMFATAFGEHPYRWPIIGARADVESMTIAQLKAFYDTFYWPDNCTVVIRGDFNSVDALALVAKHYGKISRAPHAVPMVWEVEPPQQSERRFEVRKAGDLPRLWLGFHTPEAGHDDSYALAVIAQILGGASDPTSRLYKSLVEVGLVADVSCGPFMRRNPSIFLADTVVEHGVSPEVVERAFLAELARLTSEPVSAEELDLAREANRTGTMQRTQDPMAWVKQICEGEAVVDWRWQMQFDDNFDKVTAEDIMRVARKYFVETNRTVGVFIPTNSETVQS
jgi:zinc protease